MTKKLLAIFLAISMALSITGCGGEKNNGDSSTAEVTTTTSETTAEETTTVSETTTTVVTTTASETIKQETTMQVANKNPNKIAETSITSISDNKLTNVSDKNDEKLYGAWEGPNNMMFIFKSDGYCGWYKDKDCVTDNYYSGKEMKISTGQAALDELGIDAQEVSQSPFYQDKENIYSVYLYFDYLISKGTEKNQKYTYWYLIKITSDGKADMINLSTFDQFEISKLKAIPDLSKQNIKTPSVTQSEGLSESELALMASSKITVHIAEYAAMNYKKGDNVAGEIKSTDVSGKYSGCIEYVLKFDKDNQLKQLDSWSVKIDDGGYPTKTKLVYKGKEYEFDPY